MDGAKAGRAARLGGLLIAGSALVAAAAFVLEWRFAPGTLRNPLVEGLLVGVGVLLLFTVLFSLARGRWGAESVVAPTPEPSSPDPASSLMALPAMVGEEVPASPPIPVPSFVPLVSPSSASAVGSPGGVAADAPTNSTLLIPFADQSATNAPSPVVPASGSTVTGLVDRMDALQRASPAASSPASSSAAVSRQGSLASELLLRLTRIPTPPTSAGTTTAARRCNDCGDPLGSPPHFEPCGDCGRALCERCYWRTASGPQAHVCTSCLKERSGLRPPSPAVTFGRSTPVASVVTPSGRTLRPRRPVS